MATHRHGTPDKGFSLAVGDDRTAEEAALHIEREPEVGSRTRPRRSRRNPATAPERPPRHYGFADEEPEFGEHGRYDDDLVDSDELAIEERYAFEEDLDDADEYPPEIDDER